MRADDDLDRPVREPAQQPRRAPCLSPTPVSSATGTGHTRTACGGAAAPAPRSAPSAPPACRPPPRAASPAAPPASCRDPTSPCSSRSIRRGEARSASISASACTCDRVGGWPNRASASRRSAPSPISARPGRARTRPRISAMRHLAGQQLVIGQPRRASPPARRPAARARCTARSASANAGQLSRRSSAGSCHSGNSGTSASACAIAPARPGAATARRSAATPARSPACRSGWSAGTDMSGCGMVSRSLKMSSLPETSSFAPAASASARVRLKNTSSAKPVPSVTTTRQGWRGVAGALDAAPPPPPGSRPCPVCGAADGRPGAPVQVDSRAGGTAGRSPARRRRRARSAPPRRADAAQAGQGREKRGKRDRRCTG